MNKYQCTDENGDYRDYWELVNENSEFCNEIEHLQQENQKHKEVIDKIKDKFNFYKNTEWGLKSYEILKVFGDILKEV